jgi:hypothetical protein
VRAGKDPSQDWRPQDKPTVEDLAKRFLDDYLPNKKRPPRERTRSDYGILFRKHILPGSDGSPSRKSPARMSRPSTKA